MRSPFASVVVLLALGLGLAVWLLRGTDPVVGQSGPAAEPDSIHEQDQPVPDQPVPDQPVQDDDPMSRPASVLERTEDPPAGSANSTAPFRAACLVTDERATPLPDVAILAQCFAGEGTSQPPILSKELSTDDKGFAIWAMPSRPAPTKPLTFWFRAMDPDSVQKGGILPVPAAGLKPGTIRLIVVRADRSILLTVQDPDGKPLLGAKVGNLRSVLGVTDGSGTLILPIEGNQDGQRVRVQAENLATWSGLVPLQPEGVTKWNVTLQEGRWLQGVVVDPWGRPVAGAEVLVEALGHRDRKVETTPLGTFKLRHALYSKDPEETVHLRASSEQHGGVVVKRRGEEVWRPWRLPLPGAARVTGVVRTKAGEPVAGATVMPGGAAARVSAEGAVQATDESGRFALTGVSADATTIETDPEGMARAVTQVRLAPGQHLQGVVLEVDPGGWIAGRLVDPDGEGLPAVPMFILDMAAMEAITGARSDANGHFRIENIRAARPALWLQSERWESLRLPLEGLNRNLGDLVLQPLLALEGVVRDTSGNPIQEFQISLDGGSANNPLNNWRSPRTISHPEGRWSTPKPVAAVGEKFILTVAAEGYETHQSEIEVPPGSAPIQVTLAPALTMTGWVRDADGKPVVGARVEGSLLGARRSIASADIRTNADGYFELPAKSAARHEVVVRWQGSVAWRGDVDPGDPPLQVNLPPARKFEIIGLDSKGQRTGIRVDVKQVTSRAGPGAFEDVAQGITGIDGSLTLTVFGDGQLFIQSNPSDRFNTVTCYPPVRCSPADGRVTLRPGGGATVVGTIDVQTARMTVILVQVRKVGPVAEHHHLLTRGNVPFRFEGLSPGTWTMTLGRSGNGGQANHDHPVPIQVLGFGEVQVAVQTGW